MYDCQKHTHTQTLKMQENTCQVMIENLKFVLKEGNTIAYLHQHTHQGTHVIVGMSWKASDYTAGIPLALRFR